uniref:Cytochrome P450 716B1 n=1 Tax=Aegilops tauschii TaxID=37682 RepID=R7W3M4_AEGTA
METEAPVLAALAALIVAFIFLVLPHLRKQSSSQDDRRRQLPPGSLGLPVVGQTVGLLRALRANTAEAWLRRWASEYGPISKLSLFGLPTALLVGPAANKFLFASTALTAKTTTSFNSMVGRRNIRELAGDDHRRVRAMMLQFLKLDSVRSYVASMDDEVRHHIRAHWDGRATVAVMPSMKSLTFDIMCTVIFGLGRAEHAAVRRELSAEFQQLVRGIWAIPVNLPVTSFGKCFAASRRGRRTVAAVIDEKRAKLESGRSSPSDDLMTHMLAEGLADVEIIDNVMFMMVAAHDTTATLLTFLLRHLDGNRDAYGRGVAEEVARSKAPGEALSWDDLGKMKYTWSAAMETLRLVPPVFSLLKRAVEDVEFDGHLIPKGWQVLGAMNMTQWDPAIFAEPSRFEPARFESPVFSLLKRAVEDVEFDGHLIPKGWQVLGAMNMTQWDPAIFAEPSRFEPARFESPVPPYSFVAFGGGATVCPGNEFARVEALVAMHYIVTGFKWKLADGCDGSFSRYPLPSPAQGLLIDIEPMDTAATEWKMVLVDLRNHGSSARIKGLSPPHDMSSAAKDLADLVKARGWTWPDVVVGHSMGGKVALDFAESCSRGDYGESAALPKQVQKGSCANSVVYEYMAQRLITTPKDGMTEQEMTIRYIDNSSQWVVDHMVSLGFSKSLSDWIGSNLKKDNEHVTWAFDLQAATDMFNSYRDRSYWGLLENPPKGLEISIVQAELSDRWHPEDVQRLEALSRRGSRPDAGKVSLHVLPNSGHWVHVDNPKGLLEIMAPNFLSTVQN